MIRIRAAYSPLLVAATAGRPAVKVGQDGPAPGTTSALTVALTAMIIASALAMFLFAS